MLPEDPGNIVDVGAATVKMHHLYMVVLLSLHVITLLAQFEEEMFLLIVIEMQGRQHTGKRCDLAVRVAKTVVINTMGDCKRHDPLALLACAAGHAHLPFHVDVVARPL